MSRLEVQITEQIETTFTIEKPGGWDGLDEETKSDFLEKLVGKGQEGLQDYETSVVERDFWTRPAGYYVTEWEQDQNDALLMWCEVRDRYDATLARASHRLSATSPAAVSPIDNARMNIVRSNLFALSEAANKGLEK